ncbi:hypothetical protein K438DRAFT_1977194 [Mycena galopus ATCC 62051]|nr:hypothetical protein K438DRAFT_1977194 [Mycena galopus ATCC 62051]
MSENQQREQEERLSFAMIPSPLALHQAFVRVFPTATTDTERLQFVRSHRAAATAASSYEKVVAPIPPMDLSDIEAQARQRREQKDARLLAEHQAYLRTLPSLPPQRKLRKIHTRGYRAPRTPPLSEHDLYLDHARPNDVARPSIAHTCQLCLNAKSHPVK